MNSEEKILEQVTQNIENEMEKEEQFKPLRLSDLMKIEFKNPEWLVESLIPAEGIIAISGAPASYKTWFVMDLALKVATGSMLFGKFTTSQTGVLIIDEESGEWTLQRRFQKLQKGTDMPIYVISLKEFKMTEESVERVIAIAKENDTKLIIFDSLVRVHNADENDAMKMAKVFSLFKRITKEGFTVIFTHHNRKQGIFKGDPSQAMRGSSDILASVDCHLSIERKPKEDLIIVNQTKLRQGEEMKPFKLNIINDTTELKMEFAGDMDEIQDRKADFREAIQDILEQEGKPMYKKEIYDALKKGGIEGGYSTFKKAYQELVKDGTTIEERGDKNKVFCSLKPPVDEEGKAAESETEPDAQQEREGVG